MPKEPESDWRWKLFTFRLNNKTLFISFQTSNLLQKIEKTHCCKISDCFGIFNSPLYIFQSYRFFGFQNHSLVADKYMCLVVKLINGVDRISFRKPLVFFKIVLVMVTKEKGSFLLILSLYAPQKSLNSFETFLIPFRKKKIFNPFAPFKMKI